jgi:hypothetical protein
MKNIPYKKSINKLGEIENPITRPNPYFNYHPSRRARRYLEFGKKHQQLDYNGVPTGIEFRNNGSNSKPSSYNKLLNSTIRSLMKSLKNNKYLKQYLNRKTNIKLKMTKFHEQNN